jgi:hypothetical protein
VGFFPEAQAYLFLAIYGIIMPVGVAYTAAKKIKDAVGGLFGVILAITGGVLAAFFVSFLSYGTTSLYVGVDISPETLAIIAMAPSIAGAAAGVILR